MGEEKRKHSTEKEQQQAVKRATRKFNDFLSFCVVVVAPHLSLRIRIYSYNEHQSVSLFLLFDAFATITDERGAKKLRS